MSIPVHKLIAASLCILYLCIRQGNALACYECNSHNVSACANSTPPETLKKTCPTTGPHTYTLCRKIKQIIEFEVNGLPPDTRVIRSCGWDDSTYKNKCYQRSGFGGRQEVCACDTDYCNGAPSVTATVLPLSLALLTAFKLFMWT
jgi:hypothetical protein